MLMHRTSRLFSAAARAANRPRRKIFVGTRSFSSQQEATAEAAAATDLTTVLATSPLSQDSTDTVEPISDALATHFPASSLTDPVSTIQHALEVIHTTTGMPWWVTFASASIALRVMLLPTTVYALRNSDKLAKAGGDLQRVNSAYVEANESLGPTATFAEKNQKMREYFRALGLVYKKHQAHPLKNFVPFVTHFPIFLTCIYSIRGRCCCHLCTPASWNGRPHPIVALRGRHDP